MKNNRLVQVLSLFTLLGLSIPVFAEYAGSATIIKGEAKVIHSSLFTCQNGRSRISPVGIKKFNEQEFIVPAKVQYEKSAFASDLYNECSNVVPKSIADINLSSVPVIEVDSDGEIITGYIFADNYFELFINGKLIAVDPIPFTPFNSNVVRFKVKKPYDIAVKLVDWEENSGLGSENNRGHRFHPGDGGFIASFSDGTKTNALWSAQTFYTSPIYDLNCAKETGEQRLTQNCNANGVNESIDTYSLHWDIPENWETSQDYLIWPKALEYTEGDIGVNNKKAYMNFQELFAGAGSSFIWTTNLVLDNLVLMRYQVK